MRNFLPDGRPPKRATRDERVRRICRQIVRRVPALDKVEYRPLVSNYARVLLLTERAYGYLKDASIVDDKGELRHSLDTYRNMVKELRNCARELGLSPSTATLLAKPVEFLDLESMRTADEAEESEQ